MAKGRKQQGKSIRKSSRSRTPRAVPHRTALDKAQELIHEAFESEDPEYQVACAVGALRLSQDCADAYTILADYSSDPREALTLAEAGVQAAERQLDPEIFESGAGKFWGIAETRPYMRARMTRARSLWDNGEHERSIEELRKLLALNPDDHQGVRYMLASRLAERRSTDLLMELLEKYDEDSAAWYFTRALAAFQKEGDTPASRALLKKARKSNKHVEGLLRDRLGFAPPEPTIWTPGDSGEAAAYYQDYLGGWVETPGAITWLRQFAADMSRSRRRAKPAVGPLPAVKQRLLETVQRFGTEWQATVYRLPTWIEDAGNLVRPWSILIVDHTNNLIIGQEMTVDPPSPDMVFDELARAIESPLAGAAHRPSEIQVIESPLWETIQPHLEEIGIDCIFRNELDEISYIQEQMHQMFLSEQSTPGLLELPGMGERPVRGLYAAAAEYYRRAPWRTVSQETVIEVDCSAIRGFRSHPIYAVVMGQGHLMQGLALYDTLDGILIMQRRPSALDDDSVAPMPRSMSLSFSEAFEIAISDLLACEEHGWPVAGPEAYPLMMCVGKSSGSALSLPEPAEVRAVEACLLAIPRFVEKHDLRGQAVSEAVTVETSAGPLKLKLSWSPELDACGEDCEDCGDDCSSHCHH
jgi:tetratricopeptide (TPR) repeat protein